MSEPIIEVRSIGKMYKLGERQPYYSFRDSISNFANNLFKPKTKQKEFWALKDINFDVHPGDTLGIIGRNGAGKSTLLKILSRITPPTTGKITLRGRVASLLEVGTGFNPELTGRENIFLNGAILGMKRIEINSKFKEIVEFAEIEKFLDTPVKRYSSGMYVRLAFAVAAHLEPEILLVDEVLAVGDAEFQKKCLGKMSEVSNQGRTVIFVSHNMAAVSRLCKRAILLQNGKIEFSGECEDVINRYLKSKDKLNKAKADLRNAIRWEGFKEKIIKSVSVYGDKGMSSNSFNTGDNIKIKIEYEIQNPIDAYFQINILNELGERIVVARTSHSQTTLKLKGKGSIECLMKDIRLLSGDYTIMLDVGKNAHNEWLDCIPEAINISVKSQKYLGGVNWVNGRSHGYIGQKSEWGISYE